ncbi:class I SAM-dependent methyltransferase [Nocardia sp. FBN12]|uniref:class I SAM-dependent methyltransferase n=1 Tax=Nocardia sp. FBN12 TaxID=3419766 RepID=UPI003D089A3D
MRKAQTAAKHIALSVQGRYADVRNDYDKVASTYDEYYSHNLAAAAERFTTLLPWEELERPSLRVVELAAGTGAITRRLADAVSVDSVLTAVDISEGMLAENQAKVRAEGQQVEFVVGDALEYLAAQPTDSIDALICAWGVCYMSHAKLRRELGRVLKSGAFIGIMENRKGTLKELEAVLLDVLMADAKLLRRAVKLDLPTDHRYIARRIAPDGSRVETGFDGESSRVVTNVDSIVEYVTKSGVSAGYLDAIEPDLFDQVIQGLRERIETAGPRNVPIVHRYSVVTARR